MDLSDRIEQERLALLAQREQAQAALDQRRAESERMMTELDARIAALLTGLSRDAVRRLARMGAPTVTIEIGDLRGNAPRPRKRHSGPPQIRLQANSHGGGTWALRAEYENVPYGVMERPGDGERLGKRTLSTSSLAEAVEWLELRLARGIAVVQVWQSEHPVAPAAPSDAPRQDTNAGKSEPQDDGSNAPLVGQTTPRRLFATWIVFVVVAVALAYCRDT